MKASIFLLLFLMRKNQILYAIYAILCISKKAMIYFWIGYIMRKEKILCEISQEKRKMLCIFDQGIFSLCAIVRNRVFLKNDINITNMIFIYIVYEYSFFYGYRYICNFLNISVLI